MDEKIFGLDGQRVFEMAEAKGIDSIVLAKVIRIITDHVLNKKGVLVAASALLTALTLEGLRDIVSKNQEEDKEVDLEFRPQKWFEKRVISD